MSIITTFLKSRPNLLRSYERKRGGGRGKSERERAREGRRRRERV